MCYHPQTVCWGKGCCSVMIPSIISRIIISLLATSAVTWCTVFCVCVCVCWVGHDCVPCNNSWTEWDAIWGWGQICGPKEWHIRWDTYGRHLANMIEHFVLIGDVSRASSKLLIILLLFWTAYEGGIKFFPSLTFVATLLSKNGLHLPNLLGPFHGAIAVPSVTRCRCRCRRRRRRRGHRCTGGVRQWRQ